jgi:rod shape-determining protein MreD
LQQGAMMVDPIAARMWLFRGVFVLLVSIFAFFRLLPLDSAPGALPGPDLMLALTFAWVLRRPGYVPAVIIVGVFLVCDLIFHRPPGLWALLMLLGSEFLRARQDMSRGMPFILEWTLVTGVIVAVVAANHLVLALLVVDRPPLGLSVLRGFFTTLIYPLVVGVSYFVFDVRKASPEEVTALGARL